MSTPPGKRPDWPHAEMTHRPAWPFKHRAEQRRTASPPGGDFVVATVAVDAPLVRGLTIRADAFAAIEPMG